MITTTMGASVIMTIENKGGQKNILKESSTQFHVGEGLHEPAYYNPDGTLNFPGAKTMSQCFVQGLNANIQSAHENGVWDSAEHLRWIISELEKAFVQVVKVVKDE